MDATAAITGFSVGFSLIVAIGAQNAFVLRQGLRGEHVFAVCLTCALSDAVLIAAGVSGFGAAVSAAPWIDPFMRYGGVAFLFVYGALSLRAALTGKGALKPGEGTELSRKAALAIGLALTWLNPHVYLDTVVLLGAVSTRFPGREIAFAAGAVCASFLFFFSLGYGSGLLRPFFADPRAWRVLEGLVALIMWGVGFGLFFT
ncbi:MAG: LysE/ArgO family amino acid transporter [Flavobacteriaceae bacterium]